MRTTINLPKVIVHNALASHVHILVRKKQKETNPLIAELIDKDIAELTTAINTMTEIK